MNLASNCLMVLIIIIAPTLAKGKYILIENIDFNNYCQTNMVEANIITVAKESIVTTKKDNVFTDNGNVKQYKIYNDDNINKANANIEIRDSNYACKILIDNRNSLGDLAINLKDNRLLYFQKLPPLELSWRGVFELVNAGLEDEYGRMLCESPHGKIKFTYDNKLVVATDSKETMSIKIYDWPTLKYVAPEWYIQKDRDNFGWIIDMSSSLSDNKLYLTSSNGITYLLDTKTKYLKELNYIKSIVREHSLCVIMGEWRPPGHCDTFSIIHPFMDSKVITFRPAKAVGADTFEYKSSSFDWSDGNFIIAGTIWDSDIGKRNLIPTDYIFKINTTTGNIAPIANTKKGCGYSVGGLDVDGKGNIYFTHTNKYGNKQTGRIYKLSPKPHNLDTLSMSKDNNGNG